MSGRPWTREHARDEWHYDADESGLMLCGRVIPGSPFVLAERPVQGGVCLTCASRAPGEVPVAQRWTVIRDDSGHRYLCPAERADEAEAALEAIGAYWEPGPAYLQGECPADPDYLVRLEGGQLTFERPLVNGREP